MSLADPDFRIIFENVAVGIIVIDRNLKVLDVNAAYGEMLGYSKEELLAMHVADYTHPEDRQRDIEFLPLLLAGRIPHYRGQKRYITKKGETVWGSFTSNALHDGSGEATRAFGMVENITDRKVLRQILPLCGSCKKVRSEKGFWSDLEIFLAEHAAAHVSHGMCPDCLRSQSAR